MSLEGGERGEGAPGGVGGGAGGGLALDQRGVEGLGTRALILEPESLLPFVEVLLSFEVENWEQRHCCGAGTPPAFC